MDCCSIQEGRMGNSAQQEHSTTHWRGFARARNTVAVASHNRRGNSILEESNRFACVVLLQIVQTKVHRWQQESQLTTAVRIVMFKVSKNFYLRQTPITYETKRFNTAFTMSLSLIHILGRISPISYCHLFLHDPFQYCPIYA